MNHKKFILEIIRDNQPLSIMKFDRLFHDKVEFSTSWISMVEELRDEGLVVINQFQLTSKGVEYLQL